MSRTGSTFFFGLVSLINGVSLAGEILILQPATTAGSRNEQVVQDINARARQRSGQTVPENAYILNPDTGSTTIVVPRVQSQTEQLRQNAREYVDTPQPGAAGDGTQVILRAAPLTEAERIRLKTRSYSVDPAKPAARCGTATNDVGMIGEGAGAHKSENVNERGGATVNPNCR